MDGIHGPIFGLLWTDFVMGRFLLWAMEGFVMGRFCYRPKCPVSIDMTVARIVTSSAQLLALGTLSCICASVNKLKHSDKTDRRLQFLKIYAR